MKVGSEANNGEEARRRRAFFKCGDNNGYPAAPVRVSPARSPAPLPPPAADTAPAPRHGRAPAPPGAARDCATAAPPPRRARRRATAGAQDRPALKALDGNESVDLCQQRLQLSRQRQIGITLPVSGLQFKNHGDHYRFLSTVKFRYARIVGMAPPHRFQRPLINIQRTQMRHAAARDILAQRSPGQRCAPAPKASSPSAPSNSKTVRPSGTTGGKLRFA